MTENDPRDASGSPGGEADAAAASGGAPEEPDTTEDDGTPIENPGG